MGEPRLVNCYPEKIGDEKRSPVAFLVPPGMDEIAEPSDIPSRGMIAMPELAAFYTLHGSTLYKIDDNETALDGVIPGSLPVVMERGPERYRNSEVAITTASPAVATWTNHRLSEDDAFQFTTDGTLPTGIEANTTYYVLASGLTANDFTFSLTEGGAAINTTDGGSGTFTVTRTDASYQIAIVSDLATFVVEEDVIYFLDLPERAVAVTNLDNRFIYTTESGRSYFSELNDARNVSGLSYFTAEARPDGLVRDFADGGELWRFGKRTTEIYTGSGDADEPFVPLGGTFIDKGCASRDSVVSFDNAPHWIGHDGIVYRGQGYQAQRVSDHAQERAIAAVEDKTTIKGFVWTYEGHSFYVLTCDEWTWVLDAATGVWHERKSYQRSNWRAWPYIFSGRGNHIVGDKASGRISILTANEYNELDDKPIVSELILPDIPGRLIHNAVEIDLATGEGLGGNAVDDTADPKVMLDWSDDGGHTWSSERIVSIGREGDWNTRVKFNRLGMARTIRGRRYRIRQSGLVRKAFLLGDIGVEPVA